MKKLKVCLLLLLLSSCTTYTGKFQPSAFKSVGGTSNSSNDTINVWVEYNSVSYYTYILKVYKNINHLPLNFNVVGVDTGEAANTFLQDPDNGADIFTIPHNDISKLTVYGSHIMPLTDSKLIKQIQNDNIPEFVEVVTKTMQTATGAKDYMFAAPYITQSLVLFYNTDLVTAEEAQTWEGLVAAATRAGGTTKAGAVIGEDGYNFSWSILARKLNTDGTNSSTLKLYEDKKAENCYFQGDDMIAVTKYTQDLYKEAHGFMFASDWEVELSGKGVLSVITGAWKYSAAKEVLGNKLGVAKLPTFEIKEDIGSIKKGTKFQSGSFYDCKAFVMKKISPHAQYLQEVVKYLTSKEVQEGSFEECNNLPAYKNAKTEFEALSKDTIEAKLANIQYEMGTYGRPQPFGTGDDFNRLYYSAGAPTLYKALIVNKDGSLSTYDQIKAELANIENVWKTGNKIV